MAPLNPWVVGGIAGAVIGIMGGLIGTYFSIKSTKGPRERAFVIKMCVVGWIFVIAFVFAMIFAPGGLYKTPFFLAYAIALITGILLWNKVQAQIRREESGGETDVPATQILPSRKCPQCGAELKPDAPEGLCPACLLQHGIATEGGAPLGTPPFTPPPLAELQQLFPQLEILELVGQGGMGAVYKARQPALDRLVALKILAPKGGGDLDFAGRFTREARALAKLSHPNIVAVYDFGQVNGLNYFIMEFVDGLNVRQLERAGKLSPREALQIIPQICAALQFAHDEGVVHRDIKPENVLLDKKGRAKIADFGLAKILGREVEAERLTGARDVMGTPHYMAPEQVEHPQAVDHRADIYSLGVVFYEMLTGELPLGKFQAPSKKVQIDVRFDEVVLHALEKEPERRYQQASEVKTDVEMIAHTPLPQAGQTADFSVPANAQEIERIRREVKGPAIGLLATGILNWITIPLTVLVALAIQEASRSVMPMLLVPLAAFGLSAIMLVAGLKMKRLEAYGLAVVGSLLAMLTAPGNLIGLPLGIWALVVLGHRDVRQAFDKKSAAGWIHRPLVSEDRARQWAQFAVFGAGLGVLVIGMFQLTKLDLQPYQLVFGILLVLMLTIAFLVYGTLLYQPARTGEQKPSAPAPGHFPMAVTALFFGGLSGILGIVTFCLFPHPPQVLVWSIPATAAIGVVLSILARGHRLGKRALTISSVNLAIWVTVLLVAHLLPVNPLDFVRTPQPDAIVRGIVTDAATDKPIHGARVDDNRYGAGPRRAPQQAWTDASGHYELHTWPEEHTIAASAPGYETKLAGVFNQPSGATNEARLDFQLLPMIGTNAFIGRAWFPQGDAIEITSVRRDKKLLTVAGHYRLVSHEHALLALYITTAETNPVPTDSKQQVQISKGDGDFELIHPLAPSDVSFWHPGLPHVSMYSTNGEPFAALYFGTKAEALAESKERWITNAPASTETGIFTFGPVITRAVSGEGDARRRFIDFDTGRLFAANEFFGTKAEPSPGQTEAWWRETGIDAMGDTSPAVAGLVGFDMVAVPVPLHEWDMAPSRLEYYLAATKPGTPAMMSAKGDLPATFVIQTREGGRGLLQIEGFQAAPRGVFIRYKLLQPANAIANVPPAPAQGNDDDAQIFAEQPPVVVETFPVSGTRDVAPCETDLRVRFSKKMMDGSWSWSTAWANSTPEFIGSPHYEADGKTCAVKVKLEPGKTYAFWLNSENFHNFQDTAGRPAIPYLLIFETKPDANAAAISTAQQWLALVDAGNYFESWNQASAIFRGAVTEAAWENSMNTFRQPLGALLSRKLISAQRLTEVPGAPDGHYVVMQFESSFANKKSAVETVTFMLEKDGQWKSAGYFIK